MSAAVVQKLTSNHSGSTKMLLLPIFGYNDYYRNRYSEVAQNRFPVDPALLMLG